MFYKEQRALQYVIENTTMETVNYKLKVGNLL